MLMISTYTRTHTTSAYFHWLRSEARHQDEYNCATISRPTPEMTTFPTIIHSTHRSPECLLVLFCALSPLAMFASILLVVRACSRACVWHEYKHFARLHLAVRRLTRTNMPIPFACNVHTSRNNPSAFRRRTATPMLMGTWHIIVRDKLAQKMSMPLVHSWPAACEPHKLMKCVYFDANMSRLVHLNIAFIVMCFTILRNSSSSRILKCDH